MEMHFHSSSCNIFCDEYRHFIHSSSFHCMMCTGLHIMNIALLWIESLICFADMCRIQPLDIKHVGAKSISRISWGIPQEKTGSQVKPQLHLFQLNSIVRAHLLTGLQINWITGIGWLGEDYAGFSHWKSHDLRVPIVGDVLDFASHTGYINCWMQTVNQHGSCGWIRRFQT